MVQYFYNKTRNLYCALVKKEDKCLIVKNWPQSYENFNFNRIVPVTASTTLNPTFKSKYYIRITFKEAQEKSPEIVDFVHKTFNTCKKLTSIWT